MITAKNTARVGAASEVINEAVFAASPHMRSFRLIDDLLVTAIYAEDGLSEICILSFDVCEITRGEARDIRDYISRMAGIAFDSVHVYCTHNHSSTLGGGHGLAQLKKTSLAALEAARGNAIPVNNVEFLRVDVGAKYNTNRRAIQKEVGAWCLMQSQNCVDDGENIEGTEWAKKLLAQYGAGEAEQAGISEPILAKQDNDPNLDLILFPDTRGGYAAGIVRFTAHPVICSSSYWEENVGRDFCGKLCDMLSEKFSCPVMFLQGPCGDHRTRHLANGLEERDRIAEGLASEIFNNLHQLKAYPFSTLESVCADVCCRLLDNVPESFEESERLRTECLEKCKQLPSCPENLKLRKGLLEKQGFYNICVNAIGVYPYINAEELSRREAKLPVSLIRFGDVGIVNFPGEMFSSFTRGLEMLGDLPVTVASFADGVACYLLPRDEFEEGGYEASASLFVPEDVDGLIACARDLVLESVNAPASFNAGNRRLSASV